MNKSFLKKALLLAGITGILGAGIVYYGQFERGPIYEFQFERDTQPILKLFTDNWYWLLATPADDELPPYYLNEFHFRLKYRSPNADIRNAGRLKIKTLRDDGELAGFVTYYKKTGNKGEISLLAVSEKFRGKGFGEQLMCYALNDLKNMGVQRIELFTRPTNYAAQKVYHKVGMHETHRDAQFVYFAIDL